MDLHEDDLHASSTSPPPRGVGPSLTALREELGVAWLALGDVRGATVEAALVDVAGGTTPGPSAPAPGHRESLSAPPERPGVGRVSLVEDGRTVAVVWLPVPPAPGPRRAALAVAEREVRRQAHLLQVTLELTRLHDRARHTRAVRRVLESIEVTGDPSDLPRQARADLLGGFTARELWWALLDEDPATGLLLDQDDREQPPPPGWVLAADLARAARWSPPHGIEVGPDAPAGATESVPEPILDALREGLRDRHGGPALLLPLGGPRTGSPGFLLLVRPLRASPWRWSETESATEAARDLGRAVQHAREQAAALEDPAPPQTEDQYDLIAQVAHELRTPLTALSTNLDLLSTLQDLPDEASPALAGIRRGVRRSVRLVADLMMLARADQDDDVLTQEAVPLARVAHDVAAMLEAPAARRGIDVRVVRADPGAVVAGDAGQLESVVANLVGNAVKYSDEGAQVRVGVTVRRDGGMVELWVRDEGIGIAEADQARLFSPFYRSADPEVTARSGDGLGLAIARRVVERHAGTISVTSTPGAGSTFVVRLPGVRASLTSCADPS